MKAEYEFPQSGGITSPKGFLAGAVSAGLKFEGQERLDLGILYSEAPCNAAAVFTTNKVKAAPVLLSQERLQGGKTRAVIMNSVCANACTGERGMKDAVEMTELAAGHIGVDVEDVLVASTGLIGMPMPMERVRAAVPNVKLTVEGGHDLARAIMTTDTVPKEAAIDAGDFTVGGMAKGAGMIHPDLATMLCFITTDAVVDIDFLKKALWQAVDVSFNMISVDGDNSTNDMILVMANGMSGGEKINGESPLADDFQRALNQMLIHLARAIARDGEGATKLIEIAVRGAANRDEARRAARTVVSSALVKSAVHGSDPNWGRVLAAAGRAGVTLDPDKMDLHIGDILIVKDSMPVAFDEEKVVALLDGHEVYMTLDLNIGKVEATAWGCDLSEEYVTINSDYTT